MKTANLILSTISLEIPWPVVVLLSIAALAFLWLILRRGFIFHFKGRGSEINVSTQPSPPKPAQGIEALPPVSPASKTTPHSESKRAA